MKTVRSTLLTSGKNPSITKLCEWFDLPRSTAYYEPRDPKAPVIDEQLASQIKALHEAEPFLGVRGTWSRLRYVLGIPVNIKKVHRIMKLKRWTLPKRKTGSRPRVTSNKSIAEKPNQRWATDLGNIFCGEDGWCVFAPVIDCCTREVLGYSLEFTGKARTAERALEQALLKRFGTLHNAPEGMLLRHDNGLVFGSRSFRAVVKDYGLKQEYITPYTPQQNGLCERFIKTFKEEFCWCHRFGSIAEARIALARFIERYNTIRPHQALNYQTPDQRNQDLCKTAA